MFVPAAHRWVQVSCLLSTTQQVNYVFLPTGPAYSSDFTSTATTHTVPALPSMTLSVEPVPTQSALTISASEMTYNYCVEWGVKLYSLTHCTYYDWARTYYDSACVYYA